MRHSSKQAVLAILSLGILSPLHLSAQTGANPPADAPRAATPISEEEATENSIEGSLLYREAFQAFEDHLPQVAASKLNKLLTSGEKLDAEKKRVIDEKLCEALIRSSQYAEVLRHTDALPNAPDANPVLLYWRAVALANLGRYANAQTILEKITSIPGQSSSPWFEDALLTRVSLLRALGAPGEALNLLQEHAETNPPSIAILLQIAELRIHLNRFEEASKGLPPLDKTPPEEHPRINYLRGRIALGEKRWDDAISAFGNLTKSASFSPRLRRAATIGLADAFDGSAQRKEAIDLLLKSIADAENARSDELFPMFDRLDAMGFFTAPEIDPSLLEWSRSVNPDLAALSTYYTAVSQLSAISTDAAIASFRGFINAFPDHFLVDRARLRLSELFTETGDKANALAILTELETTSTNPAVLARITFLKAQADFAAGDFKNAADKFITAVASSNSATRPAATFNAALSALKAEDAGTDLASVTKTITALNSPELSGDWQLEQGLYHASLIYRVDDETKMKQASENAMLFLTDFVAHHAEHPRVGEAHIAIASLSLIEFPPKPKTARAELDIAKALPLTPAQSEEADYLSIWVEESEGNSEAELKQSQGFLARWPKSEHSAEVLMKQAELFLRKGDFATATICFNILADRFPDSPEAEPALFFAGKSAMRIGTDSSLEEAIDFWEKVVKKGGPLALVARQHQAIVKRIQNKDNEAIALFDAVLASKPDTELYFSVLCAKGETIFRAAEASAEAMAPVIAVFQTALSHPDISAKWRNQCLYRLGESYEKAGDTTKALEAYYDCVHSWKSTVQQMPPGVYEWFYRCGHAAMRILESQENWPASISIARHVGSIPGQRAQEALDHARQLELKHIIWDDKQ